MQEKRSPNIELDKGIVETLDLICRFLIDFERPCKVVVQENTCHEHFVIECTSTMAIAFVTQSLT